MIEILPLIIFLFLQAEAVEGITAEKVLIGLLFLIVSNGVTFFITRNKNQADVNKLIAETIKSHIDSIKEINEINDDLLSKTTTAYDEVEKWRKEHRGASRLLEQTQEELADCLENKDCHECDEVLQRAYNALEQVKELIQDNPEAAELLTEIGKLSAKIARRKVKTE